MKVAAGSCFVELRLRLSDAHPLCAGVIQSLDSALEFASLTLTGLFGNAGEAERKSIKAPLIIYVSGRGCQVYLHGCQRYGGRGILNEQKVFKREFKTRDVC
jgi:hypothetical protein